MRAQGGHAQEPSPRRALFGRRRVLLTLATATFLVGSVGIALAKPENIVPPQVSGYGGLPLPPQPKAGDKLVCGGGSWRNTSSFEYEWIREGTVVATGPTYVISPADQNQELWCSQIGISGSERTEQESSNGVCVGVCHGPPPEAPKNAKLPELTGTAAVGSELSCSQGEWSGSAPISYSYLWLRDKEAISGASTSKYKVVEADATHKLSCLVKAKNAGGEAAAESGSVLIPGTPPKNTSRPRVLGTPKVNEALTCSEGSWTGSRPITFTVQWLRNNGAIAGANGGTYVVQQEDEGQKLACRVTAKNLAGEAIEPSEAVSVAWEQIKAIGVPSIEGVAKEGETLTCSKGSWNQTPTEVAYLWLRENPTTSAKENTGVALSQYKVGEKDLGHVLYCQVEVHNVRKESATATSEGLSISKGSGAGVPENIRRPEITPKEHVVLGTRLTCREGEWTGNPTAYAFQWLRDEVAIPDAMSEEYVAKAADQGHRLSCRVTAENAEGASKKDSLGVEVEGEAPSPLSSPEVQAASYPPHVSESLTCTHGTWRGAPPPTFTYEWVRLPEGMKVGFAQNYTITPEDRGHSLTCNVTASNFEGSYEAKSSKPIYVPGSAPVPPLQGPVIEGEAALGKTLRCNAGAWDGAPPPTFAYVWILNNTPQPQTAETFTVGGTARGATLQCKVTGSNSEGSATSLSKGVHVAGTRPESLEPPFVSGTGGVGHILECLRGIWNAHPPASYSYQWYREGVPIVGAIEQSYTVQIADLGHLVTCTVTASNIEGRVEAESINGVAISVHGVRSVESSPPFVPSTVVPPAVILASLRRQLTTAMENAHLKSIVKTRRFTFSFGSPTGGTLEVMWYKRYKVKGAHGSTRVHTVLLARSGKMAYARVSRSTVQVKLTTAGKTAVWHAKHIGIVVTAVFKVAGKPSVTWSGGFVLS